MRTILGFSREDERNIRGLADRARPLLPRVVDRFYEKLLGHPEARRVFVGGDPQIQRQRQSLTGWLERVFSGEYDLGYFARLLTVGEVHVRASVPQHFMVVGMQYIWEDLSAGLREAGTDDRVLNSLHRLLMLDLAVMIEAYNESHSNQVRQDERHAVEEKLTRAQHLAEIGQLAASLAHEIKNPLAGISGAIQIMREAMEPDDPHRPIAGEILNQIKRLDATVKDLLHYARPAPLKFKECLLPDVVGRVLTLLREEPALRHVQIETQHRSHDLVVFADDGQLEQVVMNLVLNAAHATEHGGTIVVRTDASGGAARLIVRDTGVGMSEDVQRRAFEAFYTTKAKGTGLGLSICRHIVDAHGGTIEIQSEPGEGTSVTVELPLEPVRGERN